MTNSPMVEIISAITEGYQVTFLRAPGNALEFRFSTVVNFKFIEVRRHISKPELMQFQNGPQELLALNMQSARKEIDQAVSAVAKTDEVQK